VGCDLLLPAGWVFVLQVTRVEQYALTSNLPPRLRKVRSKTAYFYASFATLCSSQTPSFLS
jgi:hypothetical protein